MMKQLSQAWSRFAKIGFRVPVIISGLLFVCGIAFATMAPHSANPQQAFRANDFVDSMGVTTHLWVTTGRDAEGKNPNAVLTKIKRLGVRFYRGYYANSFKNYGLKGMAWIDTRTNGVLDPRGIKGSLDRYRGYENELIAIEGPNEYDLTHDRDKWNRLQRYTREIVKQAKAQPAMKSLPILGPSMAYPFYSYMRLTGIRRIVDIANMHPYSSNLMPEDFWAEAPEKGRNIDVWFEEARNASWTRRVWATEVGWNKAGDVVQAKYAPRTYALFFKRGVEKTTFFQLVDGLDGDTWGILRYDLSEKPAYSSIKNFITIVDDNNTTFSPSKLAYRLEGNTKDIETLLLQKGNGTFDLLIWQAKSCWDRNKKIELQNPNRNLVLKLPESVNNAKLYLPLQSATPVQTLRGTRSIPLSVPDHMMIVELST
jgi:hypothetical protein